jgi:hypothetical protein
MTGNAIPIIRLEVQGMKFAVEAALADYAQTMYNDLQAAVDAACSPEAVEVVLKATATREMQAAVEREIRTFFTYGPGAKVVAEAVRENLEKNMYYRQQQQEDRS